VDDIIRAYKDAYYRANGKNIVVQKHARITYTIHDYIGYDNKEYTEKQIKGFTEALLAREPYYKPK